VVSESREAEGEEKDEGSLSVLIVLLKDGELHETHLIGKGGTCIVDM